MRRTFIFLFASLLFPTGPTTVQFAWAQKPAASPLRTAADRPIDIKHIRLDLRVDLPKKTVTGTAALQFRTLRHLSAIALDAVDFEVSRVVLAQGEKEGKPVHFSHDAKKLIVDLDPAWTVNQEGSLKIDYRVRDPKDGLYFFGPTAANPKTPLTVWSQGEAQTNRYWIPCLDQPNQRQTTELVVTVADGYEVLSNGKLVERRSDTADKTVTFHWLQDKPHAAYLVTMVVGQFDVVREDWKSLPVMYYVPKGRKADAPRSFGRTPEMLEFFSKRFGIQYPWAKYAQVVVEQFTHGGMENTSATTLTEGALRDARASLDSTADGLIAHELAHQWWGDLVTCRDWAHVWLNEGFATYSEAVWAEYKDGSDEFAYNLYHKSRAAIAGGQLKPIVDRHYTYPMALFDARAYPKGAWVLHMLRRKVGDEAFWKGIQRYGTEHRLGTAETADLRESMERETGRSLERFFFDWTERPGNPKLEIATDYVPDTKTVRVTIKQTQSGEPFQFPLAIAFRCPAAPQPFVMQQEITEKEQTFYLPLPGRPDLIDVDPTQSLLAEIKENKGRDLWVNQIRDATGVPARVRAARHFGQSKSLQDREVLARALQAEKFWGVQAEIAAALGLSGGDVCRDALIGGLKNPHPKVRRACAENLGKFRKDPKSAMALKTLLQTGDPSYFVEAAALSAYAKMGQPDTVSFLMPWLAKDSHSEVLRDAALTGLGETGDLGTLDALLSWSQKGKPGSCRRSAMGALTKLAKTAKLNDEQRQRIVGAISQCLEGDHLGMRIAAVTLLQDLGPAAMSAVPKLEILSREEPNDRLRETAKRAADHIRNAKPAENAEVTKLREEVERLRRSQEEMSKLLKQLQAAAKKAA